MQSLLLPGCDAYKPQRATWQEIFKDTNNSSMCILGITKRCLLELKAFLAGGKSFLVLGS